MKSRIFISLFAAIVSIMYQTETDDDLLMGEKLVVLSKNKSYCFHYLTQFENHQTIFRSLLKINHVNSDLPVTVGKRYQTVSSYLFGLGESAYPVTVLGFQKPDLFEFFSDSYLKERTRLTFTEYPNDPAQTRVKWEIFSRKKSYLFKYTLGLGYQFYYSNVLREGLFGLQFRFRDAK